MANAKITDLTLKASPASADLIEIVDVAGGNLSKKATAGSLPVPTHAHSGSDITSGTVAPARLGSGTPNSGTWLRGDGAWAANGAGDASTNTGASVVGELAEFADTGGKLLRRATGSGLVKLTSGVRGTAVAGTDYAPALPGIQSVAYAATVTPAPTQASPIVNIGALTGNITVNAVASPVAGQQMTLIFTQDGTGGRTITLNAAYKTNWTPSTTASKKNVLSLLFDGTVWLQTAAAVGL